MSKKLLIEASLQTELTPTLSVSRVEVAGCSASYKRARRPLPRLLLEELVAASRRKNVLIDARGPLLSVHDSSRRRSLYA